MLVALARACENTVEAIVHAIVRIACCWQMRSIEGRLKASDTQSYILYVAGRWGLSKAGSKLQMHSGAHCMLLAVYNAGVLKLSSMIDDPIMSWLIASRYVGILRLSSRIDVWLSVILLWSLQLDAIMPCRCRIMFCEPQVSLNSSMIRSCW